MESSDKVDLRLVYLTAFMHLFGFGLLLPQLPHFVDELGGAGLWYGLLVTVYAGGQFIAGPLLGRLSDRVGRKPVLVISLAASTLVLAGTAFVTSLMALTIARLGAGLAAGAILTCQAIIADRVPAEDRAATLGSLGASMGFGFVIGPALGAAIADSGFQGACFAASAALLINLVLVLYRFEESLPADRQGESAVKPGLERLGQYLDRPLLLRILGASFLSALAFTALRGSFPMYMKDQFLLSPRGLGMVFTWIGLFAIFSQGWLVRRLVKRWSEAQVARLGVALLGVCLGLLPLLPNLTWTLVAVAGLAVGQGLFIPTLTALLSQGSGGHEQGEVLGLGQSATSLARSLGPVTVGWLYDQSMALPYFAASATAGIALLLLVTGGYRRAAVVKEG